MGGSATGSRLGELLHVNRAIYKVPNYKRLTMMTGRSAPSVLSTLGRTLQRSGVITKVAPIARKAIPLSLGWEGLKYTYKAADNVLNDRLHLDKYVGNKLTSNLPRPHQSLIRTTDYVETAVRWAKKWLPI